MATDIFRQAKQKMEKTITVLHSELSKIRTGRAHPSLLDHITVPYYSSDVPLSQVCNISTEQATVLVLNVWEKSMAGEVERAVRNSDLGLNPAGSGNIVRIAIPPLTEERRKEMVKMVHKLSENAKVAVRNIRRDANQHLKKALKTKEISEDKEKEEMDVIQKLTDQHIQQVDEILCEKEKELMSI